MGQGRKALKSDTFFQSIGVAMILAVVSRVLAFGRGLVLARALSPTELGTWALAITAVEILGFFLAFGIPSGLSRYVERHRRAGNLRSFLFKACARPLAFAAIACGLGIFISGPLGRLLFGRETQGSLIYVTLVAVFFMVGLQILQGVLHGLRLFRLDSWIELSHNASFLGLALVLLFLFSRDAMVMLWAYLIVTFLAALVAGWVVVRVLRHQESTPAENGSASPVVDRWTVLLFYSLGTWGAGSLQAVWKSLDRYMLLHVSSASATETLEQIGSYFIAAKLAQPLSMLAGTVSVILLPHAVRYWEEGRKQEVSQLIRLSLKTCVLWMVFGGTAMVVLKPYLLAIIVGYVPENANMILPAVIAALAAVAIQFLARAYLLCKEQVWSICVVGVVALVFNFGFNLFLIPKYQLQGAVIATLVSAELAMILTLWLCQHAGLRLDLGTWLMCMLPLSVMLPTFGMLFVAVLVAAAVHSTDMLLTANDKDHINGWFFEKFGHRIPNLIGVDRTTERDSKQFVG